MKLPVGWKLLSTGHTQDDIPIQFHKQYSDGTDVIIEIKLVEGLFEVWSRAEHRTSGPNENMEMENDSFDLTLDYSLQEMEGWDDYLSKHLN